MCRENWTYCVAIIGCARDAKVIPLSMFPPQCK